MNDTTDNKDKTGGNRPGGTLTLKRPAVEQSRVKQSFSHGRTKTVVVETKRKRFGDDKPASAPAPEAKPAFQQQPRVTPTPSQTQRPAPQQASRAGVVLRTLTTDEREAREKALADARVREADERKRQEEELVRRKAQDERDKVEREAAAKRKAEEGPWCRRARTGSGG